MKWYWYIARSDELFIDLDSKTPRLDEKSARELIDSGLPPAEIITKLRNMMSRPTSVSGLVRLALARLAGAVADGKIETLGQWLYPSGSEGHCHLIVKLKYARSEQVRRAWEIRLGDDVYRGVMNIMRDATNSCLDDTDISSSLLIAPSRYEFRSPDHICHCKEKHSIEVMRNCPVARLPHVRGDKFDADYFGKPLYGTAAKWGPLDLAKREEV